MDILIVAVTVNQSSPASAATVNTIFHQPPAMVIVWSLGFQINYGTCCPFLEDLLQYFYLLMLQVTLNGTTLNLGAEQDWFTKPYLE